MSKLSIIASCFIIGATSIIPLLLIAWPQNIIISIIYMCLSVLCLVEEIEKGEKKDG